MAKKAMAMTPSLFGLSRGEEEAGTGLCGTGRVEVPTGSWVIRWLFQESARRKACAEVLEGPCWHATLRSMGKEICSSWLHTLSDISHIPELYICLVLAVNAFSGADQEG